MASMAPPDNSQTFIMMWVFSALSIIVMALRLVMRKIRRQNFDVSDYFTMGAIFCLIVQISLVYVILIWGTNTIPNDYRNSHQFTDQEIYQREVGSKLTIVNRVVCNSYIWLQKLVVMCLYRRLLFGINWAEKLMQAYWAILAATFAVTQVVVFTECKPFPLYWQVLPNQATCAQAFVQLTVFASLNIFTDFMLIVLPMPIVFKLKRTLVERFKLALLFSLGAVTIAIAIGRLVYQYGIATAQANRITFSCVEYFAAALVANLPTLYSLRRPASNLSAGTGSGSGRGRTKFGAAASDFQQLKDGGGIMVTRSIELHHRRAGTPMNPHGYLDVWDKKTSPESLVGLPRTAL